MEQSKNRVVYFDYLRVFATLAVIFLHAAAQNWLMVDVRSTEWTVFNIYDSLVRWGVPCFVMISGALFLSRPIETKKIYGKYILRMVISYFAWSVFYAAFFPVMKLLFVDGYNFSIRSVVGATLRGPAHFWFIPMIIGLYMCIPLLKPIVRNQKNARYFLILALVFAFALPTISMMSGHFGGSFISALMDCVNRILGNMKFHMTLGYAGYFVLGYYLSEIELSARQRGIIYLLGIVASIAIIALNAAASRKAGSAVGSYYNELSVNVLLQSVAAFTLCKSLLKNGIPGCGKLISALSRCSFGAYLVHIFIMNMLELFGFHSLSLHPLLSVPALTAITAVLSFTISYIINRIPILNKYIV